MKLAFGLIASIFWGCMGMATTTVYDCQLRKYTLENAKDSGEAPSRATIWILGSLPGLVSDAVVELYPSPNFPLGQTLKMPLWRGEGTETSKNSLDFRERHEPVDWTKVNPSKCFVIHGRRLKFYNLKFDERGVQGNYAFGKNALLHPKGKRECKDKLPLLWGAILECVVKKRPVE
jgi:hypothetical protein